MSSDEISYKARTIGQAKDMARGDNRELEKMGSDAKIFVNTMRWDKRGTRGAKDRRGNRTYTVKYTGDL